jgi:spore germination cell wall hydrolase CwlJ-like protein
MNKLSALSACLLLCWPISAPAATYGQKIVAAVLMAEAWGEGDIGMTAVAEVIRTRANEFKKSPLAVVTTWKQFSCLNKRTPDQLYAKFHRNPDFPKALAIARLLYNEPAKLPGYSKGANHFTRSVEKPDWARGQRPVAIIGRHAFYRL